MKPNNKKPPIEVGGLGIPENPVISRLKRVVDVKSLEPARPKPQHPSVPRKNHGTRKPSREVTENDKEGTNQARPQVKQGMPKRVKATVPVAAAESKPKQVSSVSESKPRPKRGKATPVSEEKTISQTQSQPVTGSTPKLTESAMHIRASRGARNLVGSTSRNRMVLKNPKFGERLHKNKNVGKSAVGKTSELSQGLAEKIDEALMLQSWRAKQWSACISTLSPAIQSNMLKAMPITQARLVNNLCIAPGRLEATVFDQIVSITLKQFSQGQWRSVIDMLSDRAIFTTSLLNGELPEGILDVFKQVGLSLFPTRFKDFSFSCTCEPESCPCEHACALLLAFAQALEEDPFLILSIRGMPREMMLSQLRDARSDQVVDEKNRHRISYELPAQNVDFEHFYVANGNFEELNFHISAMENNLMRRLGSPDLWAAPFALEDIVCPVVNMASNAAERLGLLELADSSVEEGRPKSESNRPHVESRAPRKVSKKQQFAMPNLDFVSQTLPQEIRETVSGDPVEIAADILKWLKTRGASDIRTLARRTRLNKPTIEAFLNAMADEGLTAISSFVRKRALDSDKT